MTVQQKIEPATLASAMALAFAEIEGATKCAENPAFKQAGRAIRYADLTAVIEAIKPALINHNLFFTQRPQPSEHGVTITTVLHHAGGECLELGSLFVPANRNDAQGFGSALTYARRYALVTAFGVPVEDDDGNAAVKAKNGAAAAPAPQGMPDAEWAILVQLIEATKTDTGKLLKYYNVNDLRFLDQDQYAEAKATLETRLAERAKAETNAKAKEPANVH